MRNILAVLLSAVTIYAARPAFAQDKLSSPPEPLGFKMGMT
jgi:hypothetical protein